MRLQWSCRATVIAVLVVWLGSSVWPSIAHAGPTFGGEATAVRVEVPATGIIIRAASGQLPADGGGVDAALLVGDVPSNLTGGAVSLAAGTLHSSAVGLDATDAESSLANVALTISGNQITADFLMAQSTASCGSGPAVTGSSQLSNLVINGQTITVTGVPNQTVTLPNGTAIINEQVSSVLGSIGELTVNALHVTTRNAITGQELADVVLAMSNASIDCQPGAGPSGSFTTGGGWIPVAGGKANFGVHGGFEKDGITPTGHLVYHDHPANFRLESTSITGYGPFACGATITGNANSNRGQVTFTVTVTDSGEPGTNDTFTIQVTGGTPPYPGASDNLGGGNIKVHGQTCQ
jgi:hypothetical protein